MQWANIVKSASNLTAVEDLLVADIESMVAEIKNNANADEDTRRKFDIALSRVDLILDMTDKWVSTRDPVKDL